MIVVAFCKARVRGALQRCVLGEVNGTLRLEVSARGQPVTAVSGTLSLGQRVRTYTKELLQRSRLTASGTT
jgi:hypothetical protein